MPHASGDAPQAFRFALLAAIGVPIALTIYGMVAVAVVAGAVSIPVLYLLYFYDANEWKDQPRMVVGLVVALAMLLGIASDRLQEEFVPFQRRNALDIYAFDFKSVVFAAISSLLLVCLAQIGPLVLARQPKFDDLIDGLTFGVAAGSSFAAGETLGHSWKYLSSASLRASNADTLRWITTTLEFGLLKPLILGSAVGLVVASFSGVGDGPGRFTKTYVKSLAFSILVIFLWRVVHGAIEGLPNGSVRLTAGPAWSFLVVVYLTLRVRVVLHVALIEAAADAIARGESPKSVNRGIGYCPECGSQLVDGANFCSSCGTSVRAHGWTARQDIVNDWSSA